MRFDELIQRAATSLVGKQNEDGTWFNDTAATAAAIEALLEYDSGPDPICRRSLLYRLSHQGEDRSARQKYVPFPSVWMWSTYESSSAVNRGIWSFRKLVDQKIFNPWMAAKAARILAITDADYWLSYSDVLEQLWEWDAAEPWLIAQIGLARLHFDHPYDSSPGDKGYIAGYVDQLLSRAVDSHWHSQTVSAEECTGIVCTFLFHECVEFLLEEIGPDHLLDGHRDSCAVWIVDHQQDSGAWASSPDVTSHCLRAILALIDSGRTSEALQARLRQCLEAGSRYLLTRETLHTWETLSNYQQIDNLLTLVRIQRLGVLEPDFFEGLELEPAALRPDVFISYGSCDAAFARRLAVDLEAQGINVWFAPWDIDSGDDYVAEIQHGLEATTKFIIVVSAEAMKREWVQRELEDAIEQARNGRGKLIVPVILEKCKLPPYLNTIQRVDFTRAENYDGSILEVVRRLKGRRRSRA